MATTSLCNAAQAMSHFKHSVPWRPLACKHLAMEHGKAKKKPTKLGKDLTA